MLMRTARCHSGIFRPPNSGPGGRRFKSSLPDQLIQQFERYFWFCRYIAVVDFVDGRDFLILQPNLFMATHKKSRKSVLMTFPVAN